jgi:hypothetical protein
MRKTAHPSKSYPRPSPNIIAGPPCSPSAITQGRSYPQKGRLIRTGIAGANGTMMTRNEQLNGGCPMSSTTSPAAATRRQCVPRLFERCKHADPVRNLPTRHFDANSRPGLPQSVGIRLRSISTGSPTKTSIRLLRPRMVCTACGLVERMCAPIGGLKGGQIARCLSTFSAIEKIATISANRGPSQGDRGNFGLAMSCVKVQFGRWGHDGYRISLPAGAG